MMYSLLRAAVAEITGIAPATDFAKPRSNPQPNRLYTSADDERLAKAKAKAKRDRKAAKRAAQKEGEKP